MSTALTHTTVAMTCPMLGGVGDQLTAPLSPGATQTSTSCSTMSCLSRPGKAWGCGEKGFSRFRDCLGQPETMVGTWERARFWVPVKLALNCLYGGHVGKGRGGCLTA